MGMWVKHKNQYLRGIFSDSFTLLWVLLDVCLCTMCVPAVVGGRIPRNSYGGGVVSYCVGARNHTQFLCKDKYSHVLSHLSCALEKFCFVLLPEFCCVVQSGLELAMETELIWGNSIVSVPRVLGLQASVMLPILTTLTWFMGVKQWHFSAGSKGKGTPEVSVAEWKVRLRRSVGMQWERGNPGEPDASPL